VINVADTWSPAQRDALRKAAEDAGIHVLQLAPEEALAVLGAHDSSAGKSLLGLESTGSRTTASSANAQLAKAVDARHDRISLFLDIGSSTLTLNLLSVNDDLLVHSLSPNGARHVSNVGGDAIDSLLISHFLKEFTKKTKVAVSFPATTPEDQRAEAKLRLALDHTKKALQASSSAASCSVESLKDGFDFSGSINRLRFDVLLAPIYSKMIAEISSLLENANLPKERVDEVLLVGGSAGLSGLAGKLEEYFGENSHVAIRSDIDGAQVLAKGAALQASLLANISLPGNADAEVYRAIVEEGHPVLSALATSRPIGLVFPGHASYEEEYIPVTLVPTDAPLPARRTIRIPVAKGVKKVAFEIWEGESGLKELPKVELPKLEDDEDYEGEDGDEPADEPPQFEAVVKKSTLLGGLAVDITAPLPKKGAARFVEVRGDVLADGTLEVSARQVTEAGTEKWVSFTTKHD
jgi:hypothetical protein